ncbi:MAG TPA: sugar kinase [Bryobacteraceae bacterium]|jgi:sugar/nucleoside kinase (ribokinase family)|nr:sugar kinase [Bryobacteraceae bacterium]
MLDCIVAGDVNLDLLMDGVLTLEAGKEKRATRMNLLLGGSSSITAFNLASLGARVGFAGIVGRDAFCEIVEHRLASVGVDLTHLRRHPTEQTGLTIWHSLRHQRAGVTYPGTIALLRARDLPLSYLRTARHLHVGCFYFLLDLQKELPKLFQKAKRMGLTTSLDCNYDPSEIWDSGIRDVLRWTDIFFPNRQEALALTGSKSEVQAARILGTLAGTVAIKLGSRGAYIYRGEEAFRVPSKKVKVVDTTGAGDSFNAGFLARFLKGGNLRQCALAGTAAGARCVQGIGGTTAFEKRP